MPEERNRPTAQVGETSSLYTGTVPISEALAQLRLRLLDLTARNRLLNFKPSSAKSLQVVNATPDMIYQRLLENNRPLVFSPVPEPPSRDYVIKDGRRGKPEVREYAKKLGINIDFELPAQPPSKPSNSLQVLYYPEELERQCRRIAREARSVVEETGTNMLYLVVGLLEFYESDDSERAFNAPLLAIPVNLKRGNIDQSTRLYRYELTYTGDEINENLSLREKLKQEFGIHLPELEDDDTPEKYFRKIRNAVERKLRWKVKRQINLGLLSFAKMMLVHDIDPKNWPKGAWSTKLLEHPIVRGLFEGGGPDAGEHPGDYDVDNHAENSVPVIYDVDTSQHSALIDALAEKNMVINGPPGTGKSQTITNLIAATIQRGKRILFVSDKLAALEVVKRRLEQAGLGDFCLELHSHKTNKKQFLEELMKRADGRYIVPRFLGNKLNLVEERRKHLSRYADLLNSVVGNELGLNVFEVLWRAERYRQQIDLLASKLDTILIDGVCHANPEQLDRMQSEISILARHFEEIGSFSPTHSWYGFFPTNLNAGDDLTVQNILSDFCKELEEYRSDMHELRDLSCAPVSAEPTRLRDFAAVVEGLPLPNCHVIPSLFPRFFSRTDPQANDSKAIISQLKSLCDRATVLATVKSGKLLNPDSVSGDTVVRAEGMIRKMRSWKLTGRSIEELDVEAATILESIGSLLGSLKVFEECSAECSFPFESTDQSILHLHEVANIACQAPLELLEYRHRELGKPNAKDVYTKARSHRDTLERQRAALEKAFFLDEPADSGELRKSIHTLRDGDAWYRFLQKDWRRACRYHKTISRDKARKSGSVRLRELTSLSEHLSSHESFARSAEYSETFGKLFQGTDTDFLKVETLINWYKNSHEALARHNIPPGEFNLTEIDGNRLTKFRARFESVHVAFSAIRESADNIYRFLQGTSACRSVLDENESWVKRLETLCAFIEELRIAIDFFKNIAPPILSPEAVCEALEAQVAYLDVIGLIGSHTGAQQILGNHFEGVETNFSNVFETISWGQLISNTGLAEATREFLLSPEAGECIRTLKDKAKKALSSCGCIDRFVSRMSAMGPFEWDRWGAHRVEGNDNDFIDAIRIRAEAALGNLDSLFPWAQYINARESLVNMGLSRFSEKLEGAEVAPEHLLSAFLYRFYTSIGRSVFRSRQELSRFSTLSHEKIIADFAAMDKEVISLRGRQCAAECARMSDPPRGQSSPKVEEKTEMELLRHLFSLQKPRTPIRQVIRRAGRAIQELKPCFMMGPLSVAQYLEPGTVTFDLVVMDEASQLKPEEAIGAIARGGQLIVVGDQKQLPPTTFFDRMTSNDDEEDEGFAVSASESILDICQPLFTNRTLRWHYRSKHESLIAFSNHHFYNGELIVFPSPYPKAKRLGLRYHHIANGVYQSRQNPIEATRVVDAVLDHMLNHPDDSLGVVTLNITQRDLVEEILEKRLKNYPEGEKYRARWENEGWPLFVKNLENVQGDERDVIFISTTFGRAPGTTVVRQNFGPISRPTGWRRLNVLFTRARKSLHVFSSMQPEDIVTDGSTPEGTKALKNYLAYAARGELVGVEFSEREPDSDFEISVANVLRARGYSIQPQLGVAGFFIDIAVRHPKRPGEFIAAIECDGASYHSGVSVRDRDRIRQEILESLGWHGKIWRIWSADWFRNPQREIQRMLSFLEKRQAIAEQEAAPHVEEKVLEVLTGLPSQRLPQEQLPFDIQEVDEDEALFVEVGDNVSYCVVGEPQKKISIRVTDGVSNFYLGHVNEKTALGQALLGAYEGEQVTFIKPSGESDTLKILKIERKQAEAVSSH